MKAANPADSEPVPRENLPGKIKYGLRQNWTTDSGYNEINSLLDGIGFDPFLGFLHQPRHGHAALASDLVEEFRTPLVDRLTLKLINNRILRPDDFSIHAPSGGIYLSHESRKKYFGEYEKFITNPMKIADENSPLSFRQLFLRQAQRLKESVMTEKMYEPYIFSW